MALQIKTEWNKMENDCKTLKKKYKTKKKQKNKTGEHRCIHSSLRLVIKTSKVLRIVILWDFIDPFLS